MDVLDQLDEQAEQLRLRRAEVAERVAAIDEQLERVDTATAALRGKLNGARPKRSHRGGVDVEDAGRLGGRVMKVAPSGKVTYAPTEENVERVLKALREHGEQPQNRLPELTGVAIGTIMRVKTVLVERGLIEIHMPKHRPPDQGAGRISPRLRLK